MCVYARHLLCVGLYFKEGTVICISVFIWPDFLHVHFGVSYGCCITADGLQFVGVICSKEQSQCNS